MNRSIWILITAVVVLVACGRSKPINSSELVGFYVYKCYESPKPTNYQSLSLRADGTYTLIRDDQPPLSGHWNFSAGSPLNLALDQNGYLAEGSGRSIKIIDDPDVKAWFVKVSDLAK